ncbi:MAG: hypothetical protein RAK17_04995 [Caldisphaera sp.]|nr:hypothetical protein [Caldisphaera sp.]
MIYCASVPYHITALFSPKIKKDPLDSGSIGVGIAVEPRLKLCVGNSGNNLQLPYTAEEVLKKYNINETYSLSMPLPIKIGYGSSAASTIATEMIAFLKGKISYFDAMKDAHLVEIENFTGLGDVLALSCGIGIILRLKEGAPGIGKVDCINFPKKVNIISIEFGQMLTKDLLNIDKDYYTKSEERLNYIFENFNFDSFINNVKEFTDEMKLLYTITDKKDVIIKTPGLIGYYVKKKMSVLFIDEDYYYDALSYLKNNNLNFKILRPSTHGVEAWYD